MALPRPPRGSRVAAVLLALASGCGGIPTVPAQGVLRVRVVPETASVYVDERFVGTARVLAVRPVGVRLGTRRVTVTASGHFPEDALVEVRPGETLLEVRLDPIPE